MEAVAFIVVVLLVVVAAYGSAALVGRFLGKGQDQDDHPDDDGDENPGEES